METGNEIKGFNIAEALKYAPKGLKLYSPIFGEVRFEKIDEDNWIQVRDKYNNLRWFYEYGTYFPSDESNYLEGECLLFPSNHCRTWNHYWQNTLFLESIGSVCVDTITGNKFILGEDGTYFSDSTGGYYSVIIENDLGNYLLNSRYATPEEAKEFFEELEKRGYKWDGKMVVKKEQNKPKFKVGDWIIRSAEGFKHNTYLIKEVKDYYVCEELKGRRVTFTFDDVHKNFKLWDILDAKDGDVLMANAPFIFNGNLDGGIGCPGAYCAINTLGNFQIPNKPTHWTGHNTTPATKEQRELLFQKIHEAGFEWNANTKKLKKTTIPISKFKEGDVIKHKPTGEIAIIKHICSDYYVLDKGTSLYFESQDMWELIASKVKPTLEEKVNILADEILALKERVLALEIQVINDMSTLPLTVDPYFKSNKITCDDAQSLQGKKASDYNPLTTTTKKEGEQKCL